MCGIVGVVRLGERPLPPRAVVERMRASIAHRGPDEHGALQDTFAAIGAARLSIRDPFGGHQPVRGCRGDVAVVYNGELYEHDAVRDALLARGHVIPDHADTTLLPHLWEEHGAAMVEHLTGMFALAVWDPRARRLLLARDRMGIKPLYYSITPDYLVFASEVKAIFASGLVAPAIDRRSVDDLFSLTYPCPPRTMFERVVELRPGHLLEVDAGAGSAQRLEPRRWWRVRYPRRGEHAEGSRRDHEHVLRDALAHVVGQHLVSDVPVGVYLSGGLDSASIAALAAEHGPRGALRAFTLGFQDRRFDERVHAKVIARALRAEATLLELEPSDADLYPDVVRHLELPLHVPGAIGGLVLSKAAREANVPVILTGDGADELFGGYDCFRGDKLRRLFDRPGLRPVLPMLWRTLYRWTGLPKGALEWLLEEQKRPHADILGTYRGLRPPWLETWSVFTDRERLLARDHAPRPVHEPPPELLALIPDDADALDPLDAQLAFELETRLPSWILVISDRSSMANGVEVRVPFLDHRIVELTAKLPPGEKMRGLTEKAALRGAMRGLVPRAIRTRKKRPFVTPVRSWFFGDAPRPWVDDALSPERVDAAGIFVPSVVAELRARMARAEPGTFEEVRLELTLMLVLGVQLLDAQLVAPARASRAA
ncbi:asparagine synthase (glutamine-hydrolyzing), partial [Myxococcota bacterium]|nr:asparagine synthase (glutamine-hydrolyzing) [Myxococcota bacterium]